MTLKDEISPDFGGRKWGAHPDVSRGTLPPLNSDNLRAAGWKKRAAPPPLLCRSALRFSARLRDHVRFDFARSSGALLPA
jgi:hypothetical protein